MNFKMHVFYILSYGYHLQGLILERNSEKLLNSVHTVHIHTIPI